jgi:hypothetical protein
MITVPKIVDETTLTQYREGHLNSLMLGMAITEINGASVLSVPPGVGKSFAAHGLAAIGEMLGYDLIVYIAPTRALIDEFVASDHFKMFSANPEQDVLIFEPRPRDLCGPLDPEWRKLERQGCSATARSTLCGGCPSSDVCPWIQKALQFDDPIRMVILTEAYINLRPRFVKSLIGQFGAHKPVVIIDEGTIFTTDMTRRIGIGELEMFADAIQRLLVAGDNQREGRTDLKYWYDGIIAMVEQRGALDELPAFATMPIDSQMLAIETEGLKLFGADFSNIARALQDINRAWYHAGAFHFAPTIETGDAALIVLSPYLPSGVIEARLGRPVKTMEVPKVFRHSETRFVNIQDGCGSARSMTKASEFRRLVDFYTALVLRNHLAGRRTVLVARKKYLQKIKDEMVDLLEQLGWPLSIALPGDVIDETTPVALINYGIVGVNDFKSFDALYCIGSYYAQPDHVNAVYQQWLPHEHRANLQIATSNGTRCVQPTAPSPRDRNRAIGASRVLRVLEQRVVVQAVGRVRPFTSPAEVVVMQQDDYGSVLGDIVQYNSLKAARLAACVPTRAQMLRSVLGERLRHLMADGVSQRAAAKICNVATSTAGVARKMRPLEHILSEIKL